MEKLYKFYWDCGRQGSLSGIFTATEEAVKGLIGKYVYFGEVLGKHSEVEGPIEDGEIVEVTDDQAFIARAKEYDLIPTGFNPLDYQRNHNG